VDFYPTISEWCVDVMRWKSILDDGSCWLVRCGPIAIGRI